MVKLKNLTFFLMVLPLKNCVITCIFFFSSFSICQPKFSRLASLRIIIKMFSIFLFSTFYKFLLFKLINTIYVCMSNYNFVFDFLSVYIL